MVKDIFRNLSFMNGEVFFCRRLSLVLTRIRAQLTSSYSSELRNNEVYYELFKILKYLYQSMGKKLDKLNTK